MKLKIVTTDTMEYLEKFINLYKSNYIFYKFSGDITSKNVLKWINSKTLTVLTRGSKSSYKIC